MRRLSVGGGWHTVSFALPSRAGIFPVTIHATDWVGNCAAVDALPIVHVASPPKPKHKKKRTVALGRRRARPAAARRRRGARPAGAGGRSRLQQGFGAVRMTLVWPAGASAPDPGAVAALDKLPPDANLMLELYVSPLPADDAGRAALAAYAAALAAAGADAPRPRPRARRPRAASAPGYEAALAAVYDAVKAAAPAVRVARRARRRARPRKAADRARRRLPRERAAGPLMDELEFTPAPAAGKNLWPLASLPTLSGARLGFDGTGQPGRRCR